MKEDDGRVVRRASGHSGNEPAIQVICLVSGFCAVCAFAGVCTGIPIFANGPNDVFQCMKILDKEKANINRALEADQAKTTSQASSYGQQQRNGRRTRS